MAVISNYHYADAPTVSAYNGVFTAFNKMLAEEINVYDLKFSTLEED